MRQKRSSVLRVHRSEPVQSLIAPPDAHTASRESDNLHTHVPLTRAVSISGVFVARGFPSAHRSSFCRRVRSPRQQAPNPDTHRYLNDKHSVSRSGPCFFSTSPYEYYCLPFEGECHGEQRRKSLYKYWMSVSCDTFLQKRRHWDFKCTTQILLSFV